MTILKSVENCYSEFFGSGNKNSNYWFVAIEPALDQDGQLFFDFISDLSDEELVSYLNSPFEDAVGNSQVYNNVYNILEKFNLSNNITTDYGVRKIKFDTDGNALYTNLSFLKFPKLDSPVNPQILRKYAKMFYDFNLQLIDTQCEKFDRMSLYKFDNYDWIKVRREILSKYLHQGSKKVVFILTKEYQEFASLLFDKFDSINELTKYSIEIDWGRTKISFYDCSNIYVVLPNSKIPKKVVEKIYQTVTKLYDN